MQNPEVKEVVTTAVTPNITLPPNLPSGDSLDDLIPQELRTAVEKVATPSTPSQSSSAKQKAPIEMTMYEALGGEAPLPTPPLPSKSLTEPKLEEVPTEDSPSPIDPDDADPDLDLSPDSIEKLIQGDASALEKKQAATDENQQPSWLEDPDYQNFTERFRYDPKGKEALDKLLEKHTISKAEEKNNYTKTLEQERDTLKVHVDTLKEEYIRLKDLEKAVYFDNSDEVKEKYDAPMSQAVNDMKKILDLEGSSVSLVSLLNSRNKTEFLDHLKSSDLDDQSHLKLSNLWRNYKQLASEKEEEREEAKKNISTYLSTNISEDKHNRLLKTGFTEFLRADPKYSYITDAVNQGLEKSPEVTSIIERAKKNFSALVTAISNPQNVVHDSKWLTNLAKFSFDNAHNYHMQEKYYSLEKQQQETQENLKKVVLAYRKLLDSGKGLNGSQKPTPASAVNSSSTNGSRSSHYNQEDAVKEYKELLADPQKMKSILF